MAKMKEVMQSEVRRTWVEGREKSKRKIQYLERKWKRKRQDLGVGEKGWNGIRFGDQYLTGKMSEEERDSPDKPLV